MHYEALKEVWGALTAPGAPFEVETITVRGVPIRAFKASPPNVRALWLSTTAYGDRDYLVYQDERITYAEAHRRTASIANWLLAEGVKPGERIAIAMRNYPEWLLLYWAAVSVGIAVVGMNAWWVADEVEYALNDSEPKVIFCDPERLERIQERPATAARSKLVVTRMDHPPAGVIPYSQVVAKGGAMPEVEVDPDADACIFYTSGTTGNPKGAQLTHRGCINNLMNLGFAGQVQALATEKSTGVAPPAVPPVPVSLLTTPLFHVTANNCGAYAVTAGGGVLVLMYRWDAGEALQADRAREGDRHERRAGDVARAAGAPRLRQDRHLQPRQPRRRRRAAAPGPGGQDRRRGRHRAAQHRLRHDRDLRHHHRGRRRLLRRPPGQLRPGDADLRGQVRRR